MTEAYTHLFWIFEGAMAIVVIWQLARFVRVQRRFHAQLAQDDVIRMIYENSLFMTIHDRLQGRRWLPFMLLLPHEIRIVRKVFEARAAWAQGSLIPPDLSGPEPLTRMTLQDLFPEAGRPNRSMH